MAKFWKRLERERACMGSNNERLNRLKAMHDGKTDEEIWMSHDDAGELFWYAKRMRVKKQYLDAVMLIAARILSEVIRMRDCFKDREKFLRSEYKTIRRDLELTEAEYYTNSKWDPLKYRDVTGIAISPHDVRRCIPYEEVVKAREKKEKEEDHDRDVESTV